MVKHVELTVHHLKVVECVKTIAMNEAETSTTAALVDTCCFVKYLHLNPFLVQLMHFYSLLKQD